MENYIYHMKWSEWNSNATSSIVDGNRSGSLEPGWTF